MFSTTFGTRAMSKHSRSECRQAYSSAVRSACVAACAQPHPVKAKRRSCARLLSARRPASASFAAGEKGSVQLALHCCFSVASKSRDTAALLSSPTLPPNACLAMVSCVTADSRRVSAAMAWAKMLRRS